MKRCVVTITDNIGETNMPFNEFVKFRHKNRFDEKQIVIVLFESSKPANVIIPDGIEVIFIGKSVLDLYRCINNIKRDCKAKNIAYVFHIHEPKSVIFFNLVMLFMNCSKEIYTVHSTFTAYNIRNKIFCILASIMTKKVVCVSETSYKYYPVFLKKILKNKVCTIQNGVDTGRIDKIYRGAHKSNNNDNVKTFVYVARLIPLKRHIMLLDIIEQVARCNVFLIGSGSEKETLQKLIDEKKLNNRVTLLGLLPRDKVFNILSNSDFYISTSSVEGLPISVLEGMYMGLPTIVSDIEQHREIAEKCNSLIVLPDDMDVWISKLNELVHTDNILLSSIGKCNRKYVGLKFSLERMQRDYDCIYDEVINS